MRLVLLPLVLLLSGCTAMLLGGNGGSQEAAGERTSAVTAADSATTAAVRERLGADAMLGRYRLAVETREGRVTLSGAVDTYSARSRAAMLARQVDGVTSVNNRITVLTGN